MQCLGINKHYNYSYSTKKTFLLIRHKGGENRDKQKLKSRQMDSNMYSISNGYYMCCNNGVSIRYRYY